MHTCAVGRTFPLCRGACVLDDLGLSVLNDVMFALIFANINSGTVKLLSKTDSINVKEFLKYRKIGNAAEQSDWLNLNKFYKVNHR